ncbi:LV537 protein, partial [Polypterus senegalus]
MWSAVGTIMTNNTTMPIRITAENTKLQKNETGTGTKEVAEAAVVTQRQASIVTRKKQPARLDCQVTGTDFRRAVVHWYRHTDGGAPRWLLSSSPTKIEYDSSIESSRVVAERDSAGGHCTLIIHWAEFSDQGAYMCAIWKLTVLCVEGAPCRKRESAAPPPRVSAPCVTSSRVSLCVMENTPVVVGRSAMRTEPDASAAVVLQQRTLSATKGKGRTARVTCHTSGLDSSFADDVFHWYQQRDGGEPRWMLLVGKGDSAATDDAFKKRFTSEKNNEAKACSLLINNLEEDDSATYYCARWERTVTQSHGAPYKRRGARCAEWPEASSLHRCAGSTSELSGVRKYLGPPG